MGTGWAAGGSPGGCRRLGEVLVAGKVLTEAQLDEARRVQREDRGRRRRLGRSSPPSAWPTRSRSRAPSPTSSACPSWTWAACPPRRHHGRGLHSRASDIHIEPQERDVRVRYRIDGLLRELAVIPKPIQWPLSSRSRSSPAWTSPSGASRRTAAAASALRGGGGRRHAQHAGRRPGQGPGRPHHPGRGSPGHPPNPDLVRRAATDGATGFIPSPDRAPAPRRGRRRPPAPPGPHLGGGPVVLDVPLRIPRPKG
jgi:hypothetical protein